MLKLSNYWIGLALLSAAASSFAEISTTVVTTTTTDTAKPHYEESLCPPVDKLVKKDLYWGAEGGWVSFGESFDTKVVSFARAEWVGVNVGRVACIYQGDRRLSFPIVLEQKYHKSIPVPSGVNWRNDTNGRKVCLATDIKECPFKIEVQSQPKDLYKELDFYKDKPHENN